MALFRTWSTSGLALQLTYPSGVVRVSTRHGSGLPRTGRADRARDPKSAAHALRSNDGHRSKIGAGRIDGGGVAVLQQAHDVLMSQVECAKYLAIFREFSSGVTGQP